MSNRSEIYYIEDDVTIAHSVKEYFEQLNFRVTVFTMIADAKRALLNYVPTIILVDWNMPDGQGDELCHWIRSKWN